MTDVKNPIVTIKMASGAEIKLELLPEYAPNTVNSFIYLINNGFYNGLTFHRVIPGFVIQGGCPSGTGTGGPGYQIPGEFSGNGFKNDLLHEEGILSMARAQSPNSGGSQFFITVGAAHFLDKQYAGFGRVVEGMEEALRVAKVRRDARDKPLMPEVMESVTVETFGVEYPAPKTS